MADEDDVEDINAGDEVEVLDMNELSIPVRLKERDGTIQLYEIRDITGLQRDRFLNEQARKLKLGAGGAPRGGQDFTGFQSSLITLCLWKLNQHVEEDGSVSGPDENDPPVRIKEKVIQGWPARIQQKLNKMCEKVSGLGKIKKDEGDEEEGND